MTSVYTQFSRRLGLILVVANAVFLSGNYEYFAVIAFSAQPSPILKPSDQLNIAFVTGNKMKIKEVEMILSESGSVNLTNPESSLVNLRVVSVDLPEIQEVNTHGIAKEKALLAAQLANGPCLVEDTSLMFHALGGMPGPYM